MVSKTTHTLELTDDEAHTLQLLLGFVANDNEVYSIHGKLDALTGVEMDCEDFDRVGFTVEGYSPDGLVINTPVVADENYSNVVIRLK